MSNSPYPSGNAATAAPVSPGRDEENAGLAAATNLNPHAVDAPPASLLAGPYDVPFPSVPQAQAHAQAPPPPPPPLPDHHASPPFKGTPQPSPPAALSAGAAYHADQIKYSRGPAPPQRSPGPSLLTQALATARGIPPPTLSDHPPNSSFRPPLHQEQNQDYCTTHQSYESLSFPGQEPDNQYPHHDDSLYESDGDSLTPRAASPPAEMPSSTTVVTSKLAFGGTDRAAPTDFNMLDLGEVNSMLNGHRDFLTKTKGGASLDRERRSQDQLVRSITYSHDSTNPIFTASPTSASHDGAADENTEARPRVLDHRVSMGPEKAWSIGTKEVADDEDGQVEKSITEVLAGVEPNVRSRKTSHSLRFFKEGLPEEKGKKKDSRIGSYPREKLPPTLEAPEDIDRLTSGGDDVNLRVLTAPDEKPSTASQQSRTRTIVRSPDAQPTCDLTQDYFSPKRGKSPIWDVSVKQAVSDSKPASDHHQALEPGEAVTNLGQDTRRKSDASAEGAEEGEESGEEKISSAVFLPHQGPEQSQQVHPPVPSVLPRSIPAARTHSRTDDFHPWLVKAGEPEPEGDEKDEIVDVDRSSVAPEVDFSQVDGSPIADESDPGALPPKLSRAVSQYQEENVHDHQWAPKQPLEAIELIPYKHQVGGHTTLWRFSRRAVCKQLNNRENEFYEKVERYHRDLLAFLPRYIGVLNVTFQKQPRRKSTLRRDDFAPERTQPGQLESSVTHKSNGTARDETAQKLQNDQASTTHQRVISQSLQHTQGPIPTVTFVDNQHILPRSLLQPSQSGTNLSGRFRSASASAHESGLKGNDGAGTTRRKDLMRPALQDRHANSWGATTVNKKLRNEVFKDAFLKQPVKIHRHQKGHQRPMHLSLQMLRPTGSDPSLMESADKQAQATTNAGEKHVPPKRSPLVQSHSDVGQLSRFCDDDEPAPKDVTGTSAPEPEILGDSTPAQKKKRRYSGTGLRRKPKDVRDARGDLMYYAEADDEGYKGGKGEITPAVVEGAPSSDPEPLHNNEGAPYGLDLAPPMVASEATSGLPSPNNEFKRVPRPVNPKEAQTQQDSRVEYFLLLEDLTAGMKRPCIMDLKMGTRQYGVEANAKKQKSQQGKCAKTTSRELGVRVCGLQVWDVKSQSYEFRDKYYGRDIKKGQEFQDALTRFLYDGVDLSSVLRHIPTVLQKLDQLEVIIGRLRGYRFYAASLLMFYDGGVSDDDTSTVVDDSTTDFATDTEEAPRRTKKSRREIDFKIADFANCVAAGDLDNDKPCPPKHPNEPDRGFLRGLRSLRKCFLKIQHDTRAEMELLISQSRNGGVYDALDLDDTEDEGSVSE
ncbi:hypothetical protein B0H63DRAFT_470101 [Podospora didyma]|uniref:Kinase n=1 Tax=Podospora didyma TaxID=330526 RepID=A0AAE0U1K2_9PEZI|nr:hypothetical protein B0H63DRAFT_470101 [Podospora didyma]